MRAFVRICRHNIASAKSVQCTPQITYIKSFLLLPMHSSLHILSRLFPIGFYTKILNVFFILITSVFCLLFVSS